jgi:UDP-N-acetylmuramate dehydrogenase
MGPSAGALIDQAGLKGKTVGGAMVSSLHANFIVNANAASQADVCALINEVQNTVYEKLGIWLNTEVLVVPSHG